MKWETYAGGVFAAEGKHSYVARTSKGAYLVSPVSSKHNVNRHIGYVVDFVNTTGGFGRGLYQQLGSLCTLREARQRCKTHHLSLGTHHEP